jgi:hypothetical protein
MAPVGVFDADAPVFDDRPPQRRRWPGQVKFLVTPLTSGELGRFSVTRRTGNPHPSLLKFEDPLYPGCHKAKLRTVL